MLTWVEISRSAIQHNIKAFRHTIGKKILLMPVIKSNAYGHGLLEVATICNQSREVDRICVVNLEEALVLIKNKITKPLIILGIYEFDEKKIGVAIKAGVVFPLFSIEQVTVLSRVAKRVGKRTKVHVKVDTGTSRIGVLPADALAFVKQVHAMPGLTLEGIWSHFSSSENDSLITQRQQMILSDVIRDINEAGIKIPLQHMACSASTILYPQTMCNAVRFGISLYGLHPDEATHEKIALKPALSWKTTVIQVKAIPKGAKISYNGTYTTKRATKLAILPIGYYDGFPRSMSNQADVLIKGQRCPVRGRICMNLTMVDVTDVPGIVKAGDVATLIGREKNTTVSAEELAKLANTINYEIVTRINMSLPRIVVR